MNYIASPARVAPLPLYDESFLERALPATVVAAWQQRGVEVRRQHTLHGSTGETVIVVEFVRINLNRTFVAKASRGKPEETRYCRVGNTRRIDLRRAAGEAKALLCFYGCGKEELQTSVEPLYPEEFLAIVDEQIQKLAQAP